MKLYTLGTSHGATGIDRAYSGNLLKVNGAYYLFDCAGSVEAKMTNMQLPISEIKAVFIAHMHDEHAANLSAIAKIKFVSGIARCIKAPVVFPTYRQSKHAHTKESEACASGSFTLCGLILRDTSLAG